MSPLLHAHRVQLAAACQTFGVRKLEVFGSAASTEFDPEHSDIDLLVDFDLSGDDDLFGRYFGLNEALEQLFACKVDLVMVGALKNPYFVESVNRSRRPVYASPVAQGA